MNTQRMNITLQHQLQQARQLFDANRLPEGGQLLQQLLQQHPQLPQAHLLMGALLLKTGEAQTALAHLQKAVRGNRQAAGPYIYLAEAQLALQRGKEALKSLQQAHKLDPNNPRILQRMGDVLALEQHYLPALQHYEKALKFTATPDLHTRAAKALMLLDQVEAAGRHLHAALALDAHHLETRFQLGNWQVLSGNAPLAEQYFRSVLQTQPDHLEALRNYGQLLGLQHRLEEALALFNQILAQKPEDARTLLKMGTAYLSAGKLEAALETFSRAANCADDAGAISLKARVQQAVILEQMNRLEEAETTATRAREAGCTDPMLDFISAKLLARKGEINAALPLLEKAIQAIPANESSHLGLLYAELAELLEQSGDYAKAFAAIEQSQRHFSTAPAALIHPKAPYLQQISDCRQWFAPEKVTHWLPVPALTTSTPAPVFLVGFPRSGTTLLEQMLGTLPDVVTSLEENFLSNSIATVPDMLGKACHYPDVLAELNEAQCIALRQTYWQQVRASFGDAASNGLFIDKQPFNLLHLGAVQRIFPESRVLFLLRDPRDVILSSFRQTFNFSPATVNMLTLQDTAHLYTELMGLALAYRQILPLQLHSLRYEALVESPEKEMRDVCAFLNRPWNPVILEFHSATPERAVATPSHEGISQPVYQSAKGKWRRYEHAFTPLLPKLQPIIQELGYPL